MPQRDMPTMRSKRLGNELRRLRVEASLKTQDAADKLMCGQPKISQIENGKRGIRQLDLKVLLDLYGVEDQAVRDSLHRLARSIHQVDWWSGQGPLLHDALRDYLTLEADSSLVRAYENMVIPGLFQTERYMYEVFTGQVPDDRVEPLVSTRLKRAELLSRRLDFRIRTIVDAPALHRIPGSAEVVIDQLEHLCRVGASSNVNIQVLPLKAKLPIDQIAPFSILTLAGEPSIDVAWLEHLTGGTLLERREEVLVYSRMWDELTAAALSPAESQRYIRDLIKEVANEPQERAVRTE
ncbi:helix-turn-helix domain-containing protein [Streptomyces albus]|uniref:helix-turn-helix domain-containing protein n=1 Tax=Streptomyces albus TaxID=1888 RepID=UPI003F1B0B6B